MFTGTFEHALDEKNRLMVPSRLREGVPADEGGVFYLTRGLDHCLYAYTVKGFNEQVAQIQAGRNGIKSANARNFLRMFFSKAMRQELDAAGRILIPPDTRKAAGLEKDVTLVGGGLKRFEVWDRARFEEYERTQGDSLPTLFEKLSAEYGV